MRKALLVVFIAGCGGSTSFDPVSNGVGTGRDGGSGASAAAARRGEDAGIVQEASHDAGTGGSGGRSPTFDASIHRDARVEQDARESGLGGGPGNTDASDGSRDANSDAISNPLLCTADCTPIGNTSLPTDPCAAYATALCDWFGRCTQERPYDRACLSAGSYCSPSSTPCEASLRAQCEARLTLADQGLKADDYVECARGMVDAPCGCTSEAMPACARLDMTSGKRADGAACDEDEQCAGRACRQGTCAARVPLGGACDETTLCTLGASCDSCEPTESCSHQCVPNLPCGAPCSLSFLYGVRCAEPFVCSSANGSYPTRCLLPAPPDSSCGFPTPFPCTAHFDCTLTSCTPISHACSYACLPANGRFGSCNVDCTAVSTTALPADPCDAFAEAHCSWFERCPHGMFGVAAPYGADCRTKFRSMCGLPGQTAKPEDVVACARALIDAPCGCSSEYVPQCLALRVASGTLADGATCQADSQCQSARCDAGACSASTAAGGACDATRPCERGYFCDGNCVPERTCNEPCKVDADCAEPLTCISNVCRPKLHVGQACVYTPTLFLSGACPDYTYCNAVSPIPGNPIGDCSPISQIATP